MIIGLSVGLILGDDVGLSVEDESLDFVTSYLKIPASIFVSLIYMIIVPLIFSSIVVAINSLGTTKKLKTLGLGVATYFVITTTIAILVIIITSLLASIGTPAVPGAGTIVLSTILITVGIPPVGILLLLSVDRILDMIRTMVNVTGDLTACCVFHKITQNKSAEKK